MYKLPEETINKVLAYLGKQPYEEVWALIAELRHKAEKSDIIKAEPNKAKKTKKEKK